MPSEVIDSYEFDEDAMGLGDFITAQVMALPDEEIIVRVMDEEGRSAVAAGFIRETLTDGSTVVNLVIVFDRQLG